MQPARLRSVETQRRDCDGAGDSVSHSKVTTHILHNLGDEPLVLPVSALLSSDRPGCIFRSQ